MTPNNLRQWFDKWQLSKLKVNAKIFDAEFEFKPSDRTAAWELYIELLTRIATQPLPEFDGDEKTALDSVHSLFAITREILRRHGPKCVQFTKIAVIVLNQIVRPFTAKWHPLSLQNALTDPTHQAKFREELDDLQRDLRNYTGMLADIAGVEDLSQIAFE